MIKDFNMLSGIQKVAVLFSVVGESLAMSLIKGLSKTEIRKIRSTLKSMGSISFSVKKQVMEEFYFGFLSEQFNDEKSEDGPIQPFEFLTSLNDEQLIALLDKEEPPVIAMILAQLEPDKKMLILNKLEPDLKGQVLIELGSLDDIPLEGIIEVGARLKEKSTYLPRTADFSRGGAKEIADMLGGMSSNDQERYMQTLQNENQELYTSVKAFFLTFDDIMEKFPADIIRGLLNEVELDILPIAFKGLGEEKLKELKDMLPQKKQAMYNDELGAKPQPKREVDNARKLFVDAAKSLEKSGTINLEDILSGGEMVE
ncbi:MAG: FliG C-terminal domain-containing protein [Fidelibacterota bacterium]|jgi:flagellar motor switch protein FliG|tara:strand:+ start:617 stop:1558 length:942 start_codon:yes stop_codon:yes gene_type:complete